MININLIGGKVFNNRLTSLVIDQTLKIEVELNQKYLSV